MNSLQYENSSIVMSVFSVKGEYSWFLSAVLKYWTLNSVDRIFLVSMK